MTYIKLYKQHHSSAADANEVQLGADDAHTYLRTLSEEPHQKDELLELQHTVSVEVHLLHLLLDVRAAGRDVELSFHVTQKNSVKHVRQGVHSSAPR